MGDNVNETVKLILSLSISGSLFALALFALKPFMRNRMSKSFQYYIWLVVLLRFILPFSFGINLMDLTFNTSNEPQSVEETTTLNNPVKINPAINNASNNNKPFIPEQQPTPVSTDKIDNMKPFDIMKTLADNLLFIWLAGVVISATWNILGYLRFIRYVHEAAYAVEIPDCCVKLYKSRFAPTPMLVGVIKPRIYLPDTPYTDGQLNNILLHELTHLRRHDIWLKWFTALVVSVHWFNPIVYFMRSEITRACELSCDEAVIRNLNGAAKQSYGDTLITVVAKSRYPVSVMSVTMCEEKRKLKERLVAIMNYKKKTKIVVLITVVLAVVITGSAFAFGADILSRTPKTPPVIKILANDTDELPYITNILDIPYDPQFDMLYVSYKMMKAAPADEALRASLQVTDIRGGIYLDFGISKPDSIQFKYRFLRLETDGSYSCDFGATYNVDYVDRNNKYVLVNPTIPVARQHDDKIIGRLYIISATWKDKTFEYAFLTGCDIMNELALQGDSYDISLNDLRRLAAKGDELVWEDFSEYKGQDVLSGLYSMYFEIEDGYTFLVAGGEPSGKPMYTRFTIPGILETIDIRYDNIDEFIGRYPIPNELSDAYNIIAKMAEIDTSLSITEYTNEIAAICDAANTNIFSVISSAEITEPSDPLYAFATETLNYTSSELYADIGINQKERPHMSACASWSRYETDEEIEAQRGGMSDEEWNAFLDETANDSPNIVALKNVYYVIFYDITDKDSLTIEERDLSLKMVKSNMQDYLDGLNDDELFGDNFETNFLIELKREAAQQSNKKMMIECEISNVDSIAPGQYLQ